MRSVGRMDVWDNSKSPQANKQHVLFFFGAPCMKSMTVQTARWWVCTVMGLDTVWLLLSFWPENVKWSVRSSHVHPDFLLLKRQTGQCKHLRARRSTSAGLVSAHLQGRLTLNRCPSHWGYIQSSCCLLHHLEVFGTLDFQLQIKVSHYCCSMFLVFFLHFPVFYTFKNLFVTTIFIFFFISLNFYFNCHMSLKQRIRWTTKSFRPNSLSLWSRNLMQNANI